MAITYEETVQVVINLIKRAEIAEMQLGDAKKKVTELEKEVKELKEKPQEVKPVEVKAVEKPVVREPDILKK
jgi:hypothetical protein